MHIDKIIKILEAKNTELNIAIEAFAKTNKQIRKEKDNLLLLEKMKSLVIDIGQKSQHSVIEYIQSTVELAIKGIFGNDYGFKIEFDVKRDQPECKFYIVKGDLLLEPRNDDNGHGFTDVIAFAMQILVWSLEQPKLAPLLFLDEPQFKNISKAHLPASAQMVSQLAKMMGLQMVMVSHIPEMIEAADNVIEV
jgi:hypothetical protein